MLIGQWNIFLYLDFNFLFKNYFFYLNDSLCINKKEIIDLVALRFIEEKKNVLFVGSSGVGKAHLKSLIMI